MTTITMRYIGEAFLATGKDIEARKFEFSRGQRLVRKSLSGLAHPRDRGGLLQTN